MTKQIVLASGNQGKVNELCSMLAPLNLEVLPQSHFNVEDVPETGTTFVENAIIKARHAANVTGLPAIADDSGLVVSALHGAPGIYSARYAGSDANDGSNIDKLLTNMQNIENRDAYFICVLVFMRHADDPTPIICEGRWQGSITRERHGDGGFGYDPVFWLEQQQCTSAELSKAEKNAISHRGLALTQLLSRLTQEK